MSVIVCYFCFYHHSMFMCIVALTVWSTVSGVEVKVDKMLPSTSTQCGRAIMGMIRNWLVDSLVDR